MTLSPQRDAGAAEAFGEDAALVAAVRAGSQAAFRTLFRAHYAALCRYGYRFVQSRAVAEELVSDVYLRVWTVRERWDVRGSARAYLYTAVRSAALDWLRRERVERRSLDRSMRDIDPSDVGLCESDAEARLAWQEVAAAIQRAVDDLPPRPREVFLLRWQRHRSNAQIAAQLGIAVKTVEMHMTRAYDALRSVLSTELRGA